VTEAASNPQPPGHRRTPWPLIICALGVLLVVAVYALWPRPPTERRIHVELFRYGANPSVIRVNRGDRLILTFSTRDTGHSLFLQEYDIDVKVSPGAALVDVYSVLHPEEPPERKREVVVTAGHSGLMGLVSSKARFHCHVYCGPLHGFEQGDLIVSPNILFVLSLAILLCIPVIGISRVLAGGSGKPAAPSTDLFARFPWLKRILLRRTVQIGWMVFMTAGLYVIFLTGLIGTKMSGRNFAVMVVWIAWLFILTVFLVPLFGRAWCYVCPLPFLGELFQRRKPRPVTETTPALRPRGIGLRWPKFLSNAWPRTVFFLLMGTFSTLLASSPRTTAIVLVLILIAATIMGVIWEHRTFCRFVCPINGFIGLYSMAGRLAMRPAKTSICERCKKDTCLTGNSKGWPCPYALRMGNVERNNDCGLCCECLRTCAFDNVSLFWRPFATDRHFANLGEAYQAIVMLLLAVAYCITHQSPWPQARDWVDIIDRGYWHLFWTYVIVLWTSCLVAVPGLIAALTAIGRRTSGAKVGLKRLFLDNSAALVPLGLTLWIAFAIVPFMLHFTFVIATVSDPFGWNWNLFGTAAKPWIQLWPSAVPWIQSGSVLAGVALALRNGWRNWADTVDTPGAALRGFAPMGVAIVALGGALIQFFTN